MNRSLLLALLAALCLLCAAALFVAFRSPPDYTIDMGTPGDKRFIGRFSIAETSEDTPFRWSVKHSRLRLHGTSFGPFVLALRLYGDERAERGDWRVWLEHDDTPDTPLVTLDMRPDWRVYRVLMPAGASADWREAAQLNIYSDPYTYFPNDHRDLIAPIDWLHIVPLTQASSPVAAPLWRALLLAWMLAVAGGTLWLADTLLLSRWRGGAVLRAGGIVAVVAVAAVVLVVWANRDPYTLAYALPSSPWILGIATLVLVRVGWDVWDTERLPAPLHALAAGIATPVAGVVGVAALVGAQVLFAMRGPASDGLGAGVGIGIALAVVGLVLLMLHQTHGQTHGGQHIGSDTPPPPASGTAGTAGTWQTWWPLPVLLLVVFAVALGVRLYQIDKLPYGMWRDEARHGMIALHMLQDPDYRPIYIASGGVNMPALGFYPFALAFKFLGVHTWTMRVTTAVGGALTVLPLYGFVARLTRQRSTALLAAGLLAVSSWHITISRFSFPSVFEPLFALTGLWLMLVAVDGTGERGAQRGRHPLLGYGAGVLAGASLGIAVQHYHTGRVVPVVAGVLALLLLLRQPRAWRSWLTHMLAVAFGFALLLAPLVTYALNNPSAFNNRVSDVFLLGEEALRGRAPLAALDDAIGRHALMFNVQGDSNGRHHAPERPMLDMVTGLGFLAGCAVLLRHWRDWRSLFLAAALVLGLMPSLLAVAGPHAMRSIGAAAFACTIAAIGWGEIVRVLAGRVVAAAAWHRRAAWLFPAVVVLALLLNARVYFVTMPVNPSVWLSFYPVHTQIGSYVRELANEQGTQATETVYVPAPLMKNSVLQYLLSGLPVQTFDPDNESVSQPPPPGARFVLSGYTAQRDAERLTRYLGASPTPTELGPDFPDHSKPSFLVYQVQP